MKNAEIVSGNRDAAPSIGAASVAMLCAGNEVYGVGTVLQLYATAFPEISFVALGPGPMADWLKANGARVEVVSGLAQFRDGGASLSTVVRAPAALAAARRDAAKIDALLRPRGIRIVHAHWRPQQMIAGFLRRRGYKSIWHIHNNSNRGRLFGLGLRLNQTLASWGADLLIPVSDFIAANWKESGVPIRRIHNVAQPVFTAANHLPGPTIRAIVAGRLDPEKGHYLAIEAVIRARRAGANITLDVYGGPLEGNLYADELRAQVAAAVCEDAIQFCGFDTRVREKHQQYHLGLQCRITPEPCSMWVCETLVDGLPLVASASGGTPELVADGETGLLFRPGDVDDLSEKLLQMASDLPRLDAMRSRAFERGQRLFTFERFKRETVAAYESLSR